MCRSGTQVFAILLLALASFPFAAVAEIYKWVDAEGKVHFGDKPLDPKQAQDAEPVKLKESYRPSVRTAEEQERYNEEQRHIMLRDQMRRQEDKEAQEEAEAKRRKEKEALCAAYAKDSEGLTSIKIENGIRVFGYLEEDGKPVSSDRQREIIEELKTKSAEAGCN